MEVKTIELRDRATFMPMLAIKLRPRNERDAYLLARAGYVFDLEGDTDTVILMRLDGVEAEADPFYWENSRTLRTAHLFLIEHWKEIENGGVVDVEFILGERTVPKESEQVDHG